MQHQSARQSYIQAEVYTATPQKLQLLLVEAAIKNVLRTQLLWKEQKYDAAFETLTRAQDIVAEILCSLDVEKAPDIAKKLASVYIFIFRRLTEGGMTHDSAKLDDALRILNSERETWRLVCEKFGSTLQDSATLNTDNKPHQNESGWTSSTPVSATSTNIKTTSAQLDLSSNNTQRTVKPKANIAGGWDA
ncbi:MAG: flagellar export chaperone FliS [Planctomycetaceae bacterium]|jgi:flagellar protein FliS|nr:flagellar export chaperone FliS [Planctomycetaceae bacterium]